MKHILIADDHNMFINGLKLILQSHKDIMIVGSVNNGVQILDFVKKNRIDILLMDINMPQLNGYETLLILHKQFPSIKVIALSMLNDNMSVMKMLEAGAKGYIFKNADESELIRAIEMVHDGEYYVNEEIEDVLEAFLIKEKDRKKGYITYQKHPLTNREIEILQYVIDGMTNNEIAEKMILSIRTIDTHRKNMLSKLHMKNTASLVKYALENKAFLGLS